MKNLVLPGRILLAFMFIMTITTHFTPEMVKYAESKGVPSPSFLVPVAGLMAFFGGMSIMLGYRTNRGVLLLILFLIPVTFMMHDFWNETDPKQLQIQLGNFTRNISMLGSTLLLAYFGPGPVSV